MPFYAQSIFADMPAAYTGTFSSISMVAVFIICAVSFCLFFAICIMAILGRFNRKKIMRPWGDEDLFEETLQNAEHPDAQDAPFETAPYAPTKAENNKNPENQKPETGLWQLLAAFAMFIPALAAFNIFESPLGFMVTFVPNTILEALFFTGQVFLLVWGFLLQKWR